MVKDVSDGFSIPPGFSERKKAWKEEREQDVEQSEKIQKILLFCQIIGLAPE